jgi:phosphonate metabolism protein (transferase hexapeptide repeat family)
MTVSARLAHLPVEPGGRYVASHRPQRDMPGLGREPSVDPDAWVQDSILGPWTQIGPGCVLLEAELGAFSYMVSNVGAIHAQIGRFCSIAWAAQINPGNHPLHRAALHHFTYRSPGYGLGEDDDAAFFEWRRAHPVTIGHDVWIGHGAIILPGVTIGTGAAIGAGSVVSRDIPPFAVAVGAPARPIRARFSETVQQGLHDIAWWDWPHARLSAALPDFRALDAADFVAKYR